MCVAPSSRGNYVARLAASATSFVRSRGDHRSRAVMSLVSVFRLLRLPKVNITPLQCAVPSNGYAAPVGLGKMKKMKKGAVATEKKVLPVETDANKLAKFCCGTNIYKEGQDIELKPDSEYPEWLWGIRIGKAPTLEELDPETKAYWRKLRKQALTRKNRLAATRRF